MDQSSIVTSEPLIVAIQPTAPGARKGRGRAKSRRIAPYSWLGVGAVGLGLGAALAGAALTGGSGIASADTHNDTHVNGPRTTKGAGRSTAPHPAAAAPAPTSTPGARSTEKAGAPTVVARRASHRDTAGERAAVMPAASVKRTAAIEIPRAPLAPAASVKPAATQKPSAPVALMAALPRAAAVAAPSASAATVWKPGQVLKSVYSIFVSNGTSGSPNAGLLVGNGYTYGPGDTQCVGSTVCDGGRGGLLLGACIEDALRQVGIGGFGIGVHGRSLH